MPPRHFPLLSQPFTPNLARKLNNKNSSRSSSIILAQKEQKPLFSSFPSFTFSSEIPPHVHSIFIKQLLGVPTSHFIAPSSTKNEQTSTNNRHCCYHSASPSAAFPIHSFLLLNAAINRPITSHTSQRQHHIISSNQPQRKQYNHQLLLCGTGVPDSPALYW
jgi:hypothetical protein